MIKVAKVVEMEFQKKIVNLDGGGQAQAVRMGMQDTVKGIVHGNVGQVSMDERKVCNDWIRTTLLDKCWTTLEYRRVMRDILEGGDDLRKEIETGLRRRGWST
jgi:hypothetical protein